MLHHQFLSKIMKNCWKYLVVIYLCQSQNVTTVMENKSLGFFMIHIKKKTKWIYSTFKYICIQLSNLNIWNIFKTQTRSNVLQYLHTIIKFIICVNIFLYYFYLSFFSCRQKQMNKNFNSERLSGFVES